MSISTLFYKQVPDFAFEGFGPFLHRSDGGVISGPKELEYCGVMNAQTARKFGFRDLLSLQDLSQNDFYHPIVCRGSRALAIACVINQGLLFIISV